MPFKKNGFFGLLFFTILLLLNCTDNNNQFTRANPYDTVGNNWHPPVVKDRDSGWLDSLILVVRKDDTVELEAFAVDSNGYIELAIWAFDGKNFSDSMEREDSVLHHQRRIEILPDSQKYVPVGDSVLRDTVYWDTVYHDTSFVKEAYFRDLGKGVMDTLPGLIGKIVFSDTGNFRVLVKAVDDIGLESDPFTFILRVGDAERPAEAFAGEDTVVARGSTFTLRGTGSLVDSSELFSWRCLNDEIFSDASKDSTHTLTAPADTLLDFPCVLRVQNQFGNTAFDTMTITVLEAFPTPILPADTDTVDFLQSTLFLWERGAYRESYHLRVGSDSLLSDVLDTIITDTSFFYDGLAMDSRFYWAVSGLHENLRDSSGVLSFNTPYPRTTVPIAGGNFTMGGSGGDADELPAHSVSISAFRMDSVEVTQDEYKSIMGSLHPSNLENCGSCPVIYVTWYDAVLFANEVSKNYGLDSAYVYEGFCDTCEDNRVLESLILDTASYGFRLPTEAEWEYAARAGSVTDFYWGNDSLVYETYANVRDTNVLAVGGRTANDFGLYDILGNAWEWTNDWYADDYSTAGSDNPLGPKTGVEKAYRGASFSETSAASFHSSSRQRSEAHRSFSFVGFRLVLPGFP